jgi:SOS response regulatory protein OraA/RecX
MAQFTKKERERKIEHARQLWCKGFDAEMIADILDDVKPVTVARWAAEFDFEKNRRSQLIALSELRNSILESYADMLAGKTPKISPEAAAKYAAAFEKFSAKKQVLTYMHEAYQLLDEEYCRNIAQATIRKDKEKLLSDLRTARTLMQTILTRLTNEVIGNE